MRFVNGLRADRVDERLAAQMKKAGTAFERQVEFLFKKALISFYLSPHYLVRHAHLLFKPSFYHSMRRGVLRLVSDLKK